MHDEDVATTAKWWSLESFIHDRVFRQNASMCYDILLCVAVYSLPPLGSGGYDQLQKSAKSQIKRVCNTV